MVYNNVIEYCNKNNISVMQFEQKCGIANGLVGKWKDKNYEPSISTLQKISTATGIPFAEWVK